MAKSPNSRLWLTAKAAQSEAVAKQQWDAGYNAGLAAAKQAAAKAIGKLARPDPNGSGSR